ncbi:hypothetical protein PAXRUDRAFT_821688 [Paxillus rubicundulus Ve08.2h10]|uniref:Unplaced genomic scaffold scaffold_12, whole genome shotgun sequence n=1 Tax=Paxillus rubicundulus Ve08.2h10 TaxID=930991 RepID=A0A0D0DXS6_9AGAM|nr:hypothetical protein PAXRUDRAFT_821688 [Paxillus rubicundulus Ve08.2h10]
MHRAHSRTPDPSRIRMTLTTGLFDRNGEYIGGTCSENVWPSGQLAHEKSRGDGPLHRQSTNLRVEKVYMRAFDQVRLRPVYPLHC